MAQVNYHHPSDNFVVVDVEYADHEQNICQFGLAVVRNLEITEQRTWVIQPPGNRYEKQYTEVHGMTAEDTANSPTFDQVWPEIYEHLHDQELWAHNATCTEEPIINKNLRRWGINCPYLSFYDSIRLFPHDDKSDRKANRGLRSCLYAVGLPCEHHHNAGDDAVMDAQLIIAYANGVVPDWTRSVRMMAEYEARKRTEKAAEKRKYQTQQLELFGDILSTTGVGASVKTTVSEDSFYSGSYDKKQDGTDHIDYDRLNTSDSNPANGITIVLTGFFHIARRQLRDALKQMGAKLTNSVTKNVQLVLIGERNAGTSKLNDLQTLIHNGYNIARISGDIDLDRFLYDRSLTPKDFAIPEPGRKDLNFTIQHFRKHHHELTFPKNSIAGRELYFPPNGFMGRLDLFAQMCGNIGAFGNWDYDPQVNLVVLPNSSIDKLQNHEKDEVILAFENYYNSQRCVTFDVNFITERDILKFLRERIIRHKDDVTGELYRLYLLSAGIDPEKDFKYGFEVAKKQVTKEKSQYEETK